MLGLCSAMFSQLPGFCVWHERIPLTEMRACDD